jgi:CRP-like cAMP-binding protein
MDADLLLDNIKKYGQLSVSDEQGILARLTPRNFKRGQFINAEGEVNRYTNFIISGSARTFFIDSEGREHVVQLGIRDWWISDYSSFIMQEPGLLYCEALENTQLLSISHNDLNVLFDTIPIIERFYRLQMQKAYSSYQKRVLQSMSMDAEQRYMAFRSAYPLMDLQIAQKDIASYLGMSAEFLSKIKKRLVLKSQNRFNPG